MNVSKHLSIQSYSGSLNQSEFVERYFIIKSRIKQGFTREELAFLLGRTPYFMTDYEELSPIELELADFDIINSVLRGCNHEALNFDSKDGIYDISNEKRLVRVIKTAYADHITYEFHHHWKISGEIKPLRVVEPVICTAGVVICRFIAVFKLADGIVIGSGFTAGGSVSVYETLHPFATGGAWRGV